MRTPTPEEMQDAITASIAVAKETPREGETIKQWAERVRKPINDLLDKCEEETA